METLEKLKTLTLEEENDSSISFPIEIIQDILSRLPIKPILQFRSVSKQWLSLISDDPSFSKLHFTRSLATNRTALLISTYDFATEERHFLSAPPDGGPFTHLITLKNAPSVTTTEAQHLNGLVLFTSNDLCSECSFAFVINPATRKVFKLPVPTTDTSFVPCTYFFGFHQSRNEHYVLSVRMLFPETSNFKFWKPIDMTDIIPNAIEFMIYSFSTYSWRKIDVKEEVLPIDITGKQWYYGSIPSVCVNSVIHLMLQTHNKILAFDLTTEKFSTIDIPRDVIPHEMRTMWFSRGMGNVKRNKPRLMDINGCLGLVCHNRVVERNEMYFWILQDYDSHVWVKETVTFSKSWIDLTGTYPIDSVVDMDKIVFKVRRLSWDGMNVPIYDMEKGVKLVQFTLDEQFVHFNTLEFGEVRSYVESILPLEKNEEGLHEDDK